MKRRIIQPKSYQPNADQALKLGLTGYFDFFPTIYLDIEDRFFQFQSTETEELSIEVPSRRTGFAYALCQEVI